MTTHTKACFFEFDNIDDGVQKMQNANYPCAFIVGSEIYDHQGNTITYTDDFITIDNNLMMYICGEGDETTLEALLYVQNNICKINKSRL